MSEWQLIETAARETGEQILVGYWHKGRWIVRVAKAGRLASWLAVPGDWTITPTHWQPLPEPPTS